MIKCISQAKLFKGRPRIPGDKSISHRGLIFGAMADGQTELVNLLDSEDVASTARCLQALGVRITKSGNRTLVGGLGTRDFATPSTVLDCGNSGTTMRLLMGVLAGRKLSATLSGDSSLVRRPMDRVAEPLIQMGADIAMLNRVLAPVRITGTQLCGVNYALKIASAQVKSAVMLAALTANGTTTLSGEIHSRDHSERLLKHFGAELDVSDSAIRIAGGQRLKGSTLHVPGDPSTAAFWIAAASLVPDAKIEMEQIGLNSTRIGFIRVLQRMGASIHISICSEFPEPVGNIQIEQSQLRGTTISAAEVPSLIDELPLLAVVASQAAGITEVVGARELRVKESDRIEALAKGLRAMGVDVESRRDGFRVEGPQKLHGASIQSFHDHRIAMAFSIAALVANGRTEIHDAECVGISYPAFFETIDELSSGASHAG